MTAARDLFSQFDLSNFILDNTGKQLYHDIKRIGKASGWKPSHLRTKCKIVVIDGKITFQMPGIETYHYSKTIGNAKGEVYYSDLFEAIRDNWNPEIAFAIQNGTLIIDERKITCKGEMIESGQDLSEEGLGVLNFGEVNSDSYSWLKNEWWQLPNGEMIHEAEIMKDIEKVTFLLARYKIDGTVLKKIIVDKLKKV